MKNKRGYVVIRSRHGSTDEQLLNRIPTEHSVVYRHGSVSKSSMKIEINTIESIVRSSNKLLMKQIFDSPHSPTYWAWNGDHWCVNNQETEYSDQDVRDVIDYPVLSKLQKRSKGVGMEKWDKRADLTSVMDDIKRRHAEGRNQKYLERFHSYAKEYRLHCALGRCFYSCRKARKAGNHEYFRNDSNCVWFTQYDENLNIKDNFLMPDSWDQIVDECIRLQSLVGLDITAFDVIVANNGEFKVLECNSAPSIADGTGIKYREIIPEIIQTKLK